VLVTEGEDIKFFIILSEKPLEVMNKTTPIPPEFFKPRYERYRFINFKKTSKTASKDGVFFTFDSMLNR